MSLSKFYFQGSMRKLNYEYQVKSQLADEVELVIYHNQGNFNMVSRKAGVLAQNRRAQDREILRSHMIDPGHWSEVPEPNYVLQHEISFRATLIQLALQAYYLEHDNTLPETLAELEGDYLTKLPTVPITGVAFVYRPNPDSDELVESPGTYSSNEAHRGVPYIRVPQREYDRSLSYGGNVYHLEFVKGRK